MHDHPFLLSFYLFIFFFLLFSMWPLKPLHHCKAQPRQQSPTQAAKPTPVWAAGAAGALLGLACAQGCGGRTPPPAACPGPVSMSWCHHRPAKATQPSAGCWVLQNQLLHQLLKPKALTNSGSLKIAGFFARGGSTFPASAAGTAGRA